MRLIVVRHGNAAPKRTWSGPDDDRPLTSSGEGQATALVGALRRYHPVRVISSPSLRCRQTVGPLAAACGLEVEVSPALARDAGVLATDLVVALVPETDKADTVVLCTHREVLVELLPGLAKQHKIKLDHRPPGAKGGRWLLLVRGEKLTSAKYTPPPKLP